MYNDANIAVRESQAKKEKEDLRETERNDSRQMKMTYSGITNKKGKREVAVTFEEGTKLAEAVLPDCKVSKNRGFEEDEVVILEKYLQMNQLEIIKKAKEITGLRGFMRDK